MKTSQLETVYEAYQKKNYYLTLFNSCKNNASKLWKTINQVIEYKTPYKSNNLIRKSYQ